jgi:uncharacterized protein
MYFEWDEIKNRGNQRKHRVSFETATLVFDDPRAISVLDRIEEGEERWQTLGMAGGVLVLLVALSRGRRGRTDKDCLSAEGHAAGKEDL